MRRLVTSKRLLAVAVVGAGAATAAWSTGAGSWLHRPIQPGEVETFFSPKGGATSAVVSALAAAKKSVHVQAYSFTSAPIAGALVAAHRRGLEVRVILDRSQQTEKYSAVDFLQNAGVPVFIDAAHAIAHNKVIILDEETVITGSFNFSKAAEESNAENLLIIHQTPDLAQKYLSNWLSHQRHSPAWRRR
jgi:phosphatidylserine/phosphatidylglycerophosphate/cardiolipin synthase-like enzyme